MSSRDFLRLSDDASKVLESCRAEERSSKRQKVAAVACQPESNSLVENRATEKDTTEYPSALPRAPLEEDQSKYTEIAQCRREGRISHSEESRSVVDYALTAPIPKLAGVVELTCPPRDERGNGANSEGIAELPPAKIKMDERIVEMLSVEVGMLSAKAETDERLEYLLRIVTSGEGTSAETEEFKMHFVDPALRRCGLENRTAPKSIEESTSQPQEPQVGTGNHDSQRCSQVSSQKSSNPFVPQYRELSPPYSPVEEAIIAENTQAKSDVGVQVDIVEDLELQLVDHSDPLDFDAPMRYTCDDKGVENQSDVMSGRGKERWTRCRACPTKITTFRTEDDETVLW